MAKNKIKQQDEFVDLVQQKTTNGYNYLDAEDDAKLTNPGYIPVHLQSELRPWVKGKRNLYDELTDVMETVDKASDEYAAAEASREKIAESLVTAKSQIEDYKKGTGMFKQGLNSINKGTQDSNLYTNMLVFGAQSDAVIFGEDGRLSFAGTSGDNNVDVFKLDDLKNPMGGASPIITEPFESKMFVWKLAEETKRKKDLKKDFDYDWMYTRLHNDLTERGHQNTIGMAFTDIAGDNKGRSFAQQYDEGLADPLYYQHPESGNALGPDSAWMKDPENAEVLKKFLSKYLTDVMNDVHGKVDKETLQVKKTPADLAKEIIKKYSK
tara:strand:- start:372 stop:1343 length:972 start_codon:yes stop_codon:yes gene_type:complete